MVCIRCRDYVEQHQGRWVNIDSLSLGSISGRGAAITTGGVALNGWWFILCTRCKVRCAVKYGQNIKRTPKDSPWYWRRYTSVGGHLLPNVFMKWKSWKYSRSLITNSWKNITQRLVEKDFLWQCHLWEDQSERQRRQRVYEQRWMILVIRCTQPSYRWKLRVVRQMGKYNIFAATQIRAVFHSLRAEGVNDNTVNQWLAQTKAEPATSLEWCAILVWRLVDTDDLTSSSKLQITDEYGG